MSLMDFGQRIARAAIADEMVSFGPWLGSMRSIPEDQVPRTYLAGSAGAVAPRLEASNFLYLPRNGYWRRRKGQTIKFDTLSSGVPVSGLLPAKWSSKCRQIEEFTSPSISDDVPSVIALTTKETVASGLDDGRFSNIWLRDQVNNLNYTVGSEFGSASYPAPGTEQTYKFVPLWYDSGEGGITRGTTEFARRMFFGGSRRMQKVGNWHYLPSLLGTPSRATIAGESGTATQTLPMSGDAGSCGVSRCVNGFYRDFGTGAQVAMGGSILAGTLWNCYRNSDGDYDTRTVTCTTAVSTTLTSSGGFGEIVVGMQVEGSVVGTTKIPAGTTVISKTDNSTITLSQAMTGAQSESVIFTPAYGYLSVLESNGFTSCVGTATAGMYCDFTVGGTLDAASGADYVVTISISKFFAAALNANSGLYFVLFMSDGTSWTSTTRDLQPLVTDSFTTLTFSGFTQTGTGTANTLRMQTVGAGWGPTTVAVSYIAVTLTSDVANANRLIPSGPIPPTHAGTLARGDQIETSTTVVNPDADSADGAWLRSDTGTNTDLYSVIDDYDDVTYIQTLLDGLSDTCQVTLGNLGVVPSADETVVIKCRADFSSTTILSAGLQLQLFEGATQRATLQCTPKASFRDYTLTLTAAQISSIGDWDNLSFKIVKSASSTATRVKVSYASLEFTGVGAGTDGGWRGSDMFYYSVAYRFEDDSIWAPCTPRGPNDQVSSGYNLFQVDASNPTAAYEKVRWSNIPIGPHGVKSRILLRSPKIDSTVDSTLQLDPRDLRVVWEVQDNTTTTYDDFYADDDSLGLDSDELLIRFDHMMPPRARYVFAGDSRVCHSYGGLNPCAIILAPVGRSADYDLNSPDTTAALYNYQASYYQLTAAALTLIQTTTATGGATNSKVFDIAVGATPDLSTLEKLVDAINATSFAADGQQWRAQVAPGANPQALCSTHLCPTTRAMTNCTVSGQTITRASGLSDIPVGSFINPAGTGVTSGAYVSRIDSDTQLTFVGTITTAGNPKTLTFVADGGDTPDSDEPTLSIYSGYIRVISNSLPGFLYFNKTYLDQFPIEKSTVWMTVASPGATKSAPNCWSGKPSNRHTPPLEAGISMGGFAVDNGFVVPFANKNAAIRNTRDAGTGLDQDYRLFILNEARGCCAWQTVTPGSRFGAFFSPEGFIGCDLFNEVLISSAIWQHGASDAVTGVGDFDYEAPLCIGASGKDDDTGYMIARIMKGALWVNYRNSNSVTRPDRQVVYDFSDGTESNGLASFVRPDRSPWGWSLELTRSLTAMGEGRRTDGLHLYGWNDANASSVGDGRIDEFETSDTDNGTAISSSAKTPWLQFAPDFLSGQEIILEHSSPSGATVSLKYHRSFSDDSYTLTPTTSSTLVVSRDLKLLTTPARAVTAACYLEFLQTAGSAAELRRMMLKVKKTRNFRPSP